MRFTACDPKLIKIWTDSERRGWEETGHIPEADGVIFKCPECLKGKGPSGVGVHSIICWRPRVPVDPERFTGPGRWEIQATCWEDFTLVAGSSSVFLSESACHAHFLVQSGEVTFTADSGPEHATRG